MKIVVLLADGFEEVEAITPIDYARRAGIDVTVAGVSGRDVLGGHGIRVSSDITLDELHGSFDAVIIPGGTGGAENISSDEASMALIRRHLYDGALVAAICAAPAVVLGRHSLLSDRRFTCYPGLEETVEVGTHSEDRVVIDGNLITSRGAGTAAEFSFAIIEYLLDVETAESVRSQILYAVA